MNEHQAVTSCIVHLADSANIKGVTSNKRCSGLIGLCFESPNDTIHVTVKRPRKMTANYDGFESHRQTVALDLAFATT